MAKRHFVVVKVPHHGMWYDSKPFIPDTMVTDFRKFGATLIQRGNWNTQCYWVAKFKFKTQKEALAFSMKHTDRIIKNYEG